MKKDKNINKANNKKLNNLIQAKLLPALNKNLGFLVFALSLFSVRWSLADHYRVPTGSMKPSIEIGDHIFVDKTAYQLKIPFTNIPLVKTGKPSRADVVVFTAPLSEQTRMVKRAIGLPGDTIKIENGFVSVNGFKEAYAPIKYFNKEALIHFHVKILERSYAVQRYVH